MSISTKSQNFTKLEMAPHSYRHEIKFEADPHKAEIIRHKIESIMAADSFADSYGCYRVNSIYFETPYNQDYILKELGTRERQKLRLRNYTGSDMFKLEIKSKIGDVATKYVTTLARDEALDVFGGEYGILLDKNTPDSLYTYYQLKANVYRPLINVSYDRHAYFFGDEGFRITFDSDIRVGAANEEFFREKIPLFPVTDKTVIEVKYDSFVPHWITKLMSDMGLNAGSFSKYTAGYDTLFGL